MASFMSGCMACAQLQNLEPTRQGQPAYCNSHCRSDGPLCSAGVAVAAAALSESHQPFLQGPSNPGAPVPASSSHVNPFRHQLAPAAQGEQQTPTQARPPTQTPFTQPDSQCQQQQHHNKVHPRRPAALVRHHTAPLFFEGPGGRPRAPRLTSMGLPLFPGAGAPHAPLLPPSTTTQTRTHTHSLDPSEDELTGPIDLAAVEAIYRELYPKFSTRRTQSPRTGKHSLIMPSSSTTTTTTTTSSSFPDSASTMSDVSLLTPPSLLRHLPCTDDSADAFASEPAQPLRTSQMAQMPQLSPYKHRSPFLHLPERRSAPRRSFEFASSAPMTAKTSLTATGTEKTKTLGGFATVASTTKTRDISPGDPSLLQGPNSLGLEVEHIEDAASPCSLSPLFLNSPVINNENRPSKAVAVAAPKANKRTKQPPAPPTGNALSPPACRSPLRSVQLAANAMAQLGMQEQDDGIRSVDGCRYTLGEREAQYIAKRLVEEQRKRQAKERNEEDPAMSSSKKKNSIAAGGEERGRSRTKKRAASWSAASQLSLSLTQAR